MQLHNAQQTVTTLTLSIMLNSTFVLHIFMLMGQVDSNMMYSICHKKCNTYVTNIVHMLENNFKESGSHAQCTPPPQLVWLAGQSYVARIIFLVLPHDRQACCNVPISDSNSLLVHDFLHNHCPSAVLIQVSFSWGRCSMPAWPAYACLFQCPKM